MKIVNSWTAFDENFMVEHGVNKDFYPCNYPMYKYNIQKKTIGFENLFYACCNHARVHRDSQFYRKYGAFLILRNDGLIAKNINVSKIKMIPQKPGTILILKLHLLHHVIKDNRLPQSNDSYWISASFDFDNSTQDEITDVFRKFLVWHKSKNG